MVQQPTSEFQIVVKAVGYLRTHWWLFLLEVFFLYGYALLRFMRAPNIYESYASLLIDTTKRQMYQNMLMGTVNFANNSKKKNMVHLLTGEEAMERFRTSFTDHYNTEGRPQHLKSYFHNGVAMSPNIFRAWVSLNWDTTSDIYSIRCTAPNPDAARDICLIFTNSTQQFYPEIGQRDSVMKREFLTRESASLSRQITEKELEFSEFQKRNQDFINFMAVNLDGKGILMMRTKATELKQRLNAIAGTKKKLQEAPKAYVARYDEAHEALNTRLSELHYKRYLTDQSADPEKPSRMDAIDKEIALVTDQLDKLFLKEEENSIKYPLTPSEIRRRIAELDNEFRTTHLNLQMLTMEIAELESKQRKFQQQQFEYERFLSELGHKKRMLANLYQREQETELELSAGGSDIFRLQEPSRSDHRISPQLSRFLFGALSLTLVSIICTALLLIAFLPRLDNEVEVYKLNLPVLGKIPVLKGRFGDFDNLSPFALEFLKIMNYRILRETKDSRCPIILVSSPQTGEGKSTVAYFLNLASQSPKRKSLLIDGDLITSHPNVFFGIKEDHTPGLKALLDEGTVPPFSSLLVKTIHEGIYFLPRGGRCDPMASPHFLKPVEIALTQLRGEFDLIFIDTPPLFSSNLTHQWAGVADLIVLVARIYLTRPKEIVEALQTMKIFSKAPVGVALNCLPISSSQKRASNYYFSRRKPTKLAA